MSFAEDWKQARRLALAAAAGVALAQCSGGSGEPVERTASSGQSIVGGMVADTAGSPVIYLSIPAGTCSGVLVAPNLVATARHCTADETPGSYECSASGELMVGSMGGQLGADLAPSSILFYLADTVAAGGRKGPPDAVGAQIVSTGSPSECRDDLAFVVLAQPITSVAPAPIRLGPTRIGEAVSAWGYGITDQAQDPRLLRVREGAQVQGVGPTMPISLTQAAPLRTILIGPGAIGCPGDSGGPVTAEATGAVISLTADTAGQAAGQCADISAATTFGPQLADYATVIASAFAAAGATPILETGTADAGSPDATPATDAGPPVADAVGPVPVPSSGTASGGCAIGLPGAARATLAPIAAIALALGAVVHRRKRRS